MTTVYEYNKRRADCYRSFAVCCTMPLKGRFNQKAQEIEDALEAIPVDLASEPVLRGLSPKQVVR